MQQVVEAALANGRKVAFLGRSMEQNSEIARTMGMISIADSQLVDLADAAQLPPGEVCIVCTGSQGEPMSALALMAAHEHKRITISSDDVVVFSAHAIPGNEANVGGVINALHRAGAEVIHDRTAHVHVSGHASQEELKHLLTLLQPEYFVPVHGEYRQMTHHARLAHEVGVAAATSRSARTATSSPWARGASRWRGAACRPATSTSTAPSATSATGSCATDGPSPRRASSW